MATREQVRRALRQQPFRPFRLRMVDGKEYTVPDIEWLSIPPFDRVREIAFYVKPTDVPADQVQDYEVHWLDLGLISEVIEERVTTASPTGDNGA